MKKMNNKGFSLVELIIVIAIMAILIAVLAPQYIKYVEKSRQSSDLDNWQSIINAVQVAYADTEKPATGTNTVTCTSGSIGHTGDISWGDLGVDLDKMTMKSKMYGQTGQIEASAGSDGIVTIKCKNNSSLASQLGLASN